MWTLNFLEQLHVFFLISFYEIYCEVRHVITKNSNFLLLICWRHIGVLFNWDVKETLSREKITFGICSTPSGNYCNTRLSSWMRRESVINLNSYPTDGAKTYLILIQFYWKCCINHLWLWCGWCDTIVLLPQL